MRLLEDNFMVRVRDIADETRIDPADVARALDALEGSYVVKFEKAMTGGDPNPWYIRKVTPDARRTVGQWPTPENMVTRLAEAFGVAAEHEPDPGRKRRLRDIASFLADTGKDLAAEVVAKVILRQTGMG
ncbi:MAG TPA: hypothetical protein VGS19_07645 [Streptosporangiaceae bacterium]|nr:hypothetical protein [Streptosporangiaceae bacterium]